MSNYFTELFEINVSDKIEQKNGLSYVSWAYAWGELKKKHPDATYTVYENADGMFYHTDGKTCWVKTGVTVNGIEHIEYLPVMDFRNKSISADNVTSFDVNKTVQRSLTKAIARHGLGLYVYAGEDLPEAENEAPKEEPKKKKTKQSAEERAKLETINDGGVDYLENLIKEYGTDKDALMAFYKVESLYDLTTAQFNHCVKALKAKYEKGQ